MKEFLKIIEERINFFFKKDFKFYSVRDKIKKIDIDSEESVINFLKSNFEELKQIILSEDLDLLGEEMLFLNGIIYSSNINRSRKNDYFWIQNRNKLIIFDLNENNFEEKLFIISCHIYCMADVAIETIVYDSNISKIIDCKKEKQSISIDFFSSYIQEVYNSEIKFFSEKERFFISSEIRDIESLNNYNKINFIVGNSSVQAGKGTEIHIVTDFANVTTNGHVDIVKGRAYVTLGNEGDILTAAENAVVLTKGSQGILSCLGDSLFIRFQEEPEPEIPTNFYHGWYKKERIIQLARLGNCRILD